MKKFYCALAAAALALTANAADYYLIGGFNGWKLKDAKCKFSKGSTTNEYVLNYEGTLSSGFKINDGTWANDLVNFGGSSVLEVGKEYTLSVGGTSGNISLAGNIENPKLVLNVSDPAAPTLLIKGQETEASYSYVLWGNFDGGEDWSGIDLIEKDGKYTANATVADCAFGIKEVDDATGGQARWLSSAGDAAVTVGTAMPIQAEGTNFTLAAGTYTVTLDMAAMTLLVSGEGDDPTPPTPPVGDYKDLYLVGGFNDWTNPSDLKFTREGNVYTLVVEDGLSGKWKLTDGTWDYNFGAGSEQPANGVEVDAWFKSGSDFDTAFSGKTTIVFTLVEGSDVDDTSIPAKIKVTAEGVAEPDPVEEWYVSVQGDFNGWKGEGVHPNAEGNAQIEALKINEKGFKIKVYNGLADSWYCNASQIALDSPVVLEGDGNPNMTIAGWMEGKYYDVKYNVLSNTLEVTENTEAGVAFIEAQDGAAVYFNLQGMKVENPENGIFVKVANGKAVKVKR